jgi:hypothetical protein
MHLRVLAVNVWNSAGDPRRLGLLNSEIRRIAPDLVAFEEVPFRQSSPAISTPLLTRRASATFSDDVVAAAMIDRLVHHASLQCRRARWAAGRSTKPLPRSRFYWSAFAGSCPDIEAGEASIVRRIRSSALAR